MLHMMFNPESRDLGSKKEHLYGKIDCSNIMGINGYCDNQAVRIIRKRIERFP